jgi:hypothetical protein
MNVVVGSAYTMEHAIFRLDHLFHMLVQTLPKGLGENRLPSFGSENQMDVNAGKGLAHDTDLSCIGL